MVAQTVQVNTLLEASPAALLVQTASQFNSKISIQLDDKIANAKSIMGVISLGIADGQEIKIIADGDDEKQVCPALEQFFRANPQP